MQCSSEKRGKAGDRGNRVLKSDELPSALPCMEEIVALIGKRTPVLFLDYDGTLTPIVERPERAVLAGEARRAVAACASGFPVAVVSGRDLKDVKSLVGLENVIYAGSHGFDIEVPGTGRTSHRMGEDFLPLFDKIEDELTDRLAGIEGAQVERKTFSIAVHYRRVGARDFPAVAGAVDAVCRRAVGLRKKGGKKVFELQPDIDWHKGKAVLWLLESQGWDDGSHFPIYVGDDLTDEDAFRALKGRGIGIIVRDESRPTAALYALENTGEVGLFLSRLLALAEDLPTARTQL